jgi:hypothetical protein
VDERGFDDFARSLAAGANRRTVVRMLVGAMAAIGSGAVTREAEAARRGYPGPLASSDPGPCRPDCNGLTCGPDGCGGTCACPGGGHCICLATSGIPNGGTNCAVNEALHPDAGCRSNGDCQGQYGEPYFCDSSSGTCYLSCLP